MDHILIDRQTFTSSSKCRIRTMMTRNQQKIHSNNPTNDDDEAPYSPIVQRVVTDIGTMDLKQYIILPLSLEGSNNSNKITTTTTPTTPSTTTTARTCICLSKHLCGPACDSALQSIQRVTPTTIRPSYILIATCCHYLCTWDHFVGKEFWLLCGLNQKDFNVAITCSQWASLKPTNKNKKKTQKQQQQKDVVPQQPKSSSLLEQRKNKKQKKIQSMTNTTRGDDTNNLPNNGNLTNIPLTTMNGTSTPNSATPNSTTRSQNSNVVDLMQRAKEAGTKLASSTTIRPHQFIPSQEFEQSYTREEKIHLGKQLKQLLDLARISYLQTQGDYTHVELVRFTTRSIEDRLLVAYR